MSTTRSLWIVGMLWALVAAAPAEPLPTMEELKAQLSINPAGVLRGVARLMALKGDAAKPYDKYDLLCLKGEAYLRNKQLPIAADTFASAINATEDEKKQSLARATEILIRRCKPYGYMPGQGTTRPALPMLILAPEDRKEALATLWADARYVTKPKVDAAMRTTDIKVVLATGPMIADLRSLEIAVTGQAAETKKIAIPIAARAHPAVKPLIDLMIKRTDEIREWAATEVKHRAPYSNNRVIADHNGLYPEDKDKLKLILQTSADFAISAGDLATASENAELMDDVAKCKKLYERAKTILEYNWHTNQVIPSSVGN